MSIAPQLILAPTIHRAKQLEQKFKNPLARSLTISNFIKTLYERYGTKRYIDQQEAKYILATIIKNSDLLYFDYLSLESEAVEEIAHYFVALKRNGVEVSAFNYVKEKEAELQVLFEKYNGFLLQHELADQGDMELEVFEVLKSNSEATKPFGALFVDAFISNNIHFTSSNLEKKILDFLVETVGEPCPQIESSSSDVNFFEPKPKPFNQTDEVASALKIARRLLDEGSNADEIIIVTTSIDEYTSLFESQLESYGLKGYSSKGVPLKHYLPQLKKE